MIFILLPTLGNIRWEVFLCRQRGRRDARGSRADSGSGIYARNGRAAFAVFLVNHGRFA